MVSNQWWWWRGEGYKLGGCSLSQCRIMKLGQCVTTSYLVTLNHGASVHCTRVTHNSGAELIHLSRTIQTFDTFIGHVTGTTLA